MKTVADIMTRKIISVKDSDNLHHGRMLLKQYGIRHLPVVNAEDQYVGLLTQRDVLNNALHVVEKFGFSKLTAREERMLVKDVISTDNFFLVSTATLHEAGEFFVGNKHSCLPIVDDGKLVGILSPVDFVKLALQLLEKDS